MHWIALVEGPGHVCCRYRVTAFQPHLQRAGYTLEPRTLPARWWQRVRLFRDLAGANVILQRRLLPAWQLPLLRRAVRRLVFDLDDAVFLRDSYAPRGLHDPRRLRRFAATVRSCDAVAAGNTFLHSQASRWAAGRPVHVIPTCVDPHRYTVAEHLEGERATRLVWVGSSSTLHGLEEIRPLLEDMGRRLPNLELKLVCDRFLTFRYLGVVPCPWTEEGEAAALAAADIGISWMPDDLWSRGKCGLKVLQYLAAGLPVVANPVGVHVEMVRHGETGFLAETPAQWVEAVGRLAHDPALRRRMGQAGRRLVESGYSVAAGAARWRVLMEGLEGPLAQAG
jgi:glycosyltransferase involved in cell wall biosynthesis